ncbi:disease resistance protein RPM1-like isoform X2 [Rosa chinensis]|uniref:disease resistance protein RPM1-like isoform X2 n=1 Tax=Rosa chinensis TaxID=74649 RepID=UPI000D08D33C|nr:disease resistance protein RPM1-like isoform X2 [Rosa chinensis]
MEWPESSKPEEVKHPKEVEEEEKFKVGLQSGRLKPPPQMSVPVIDNASSTWDIMRGLGPEGQTSHEEVEEEDNLITSDDEEDHISIKEIVSSSGYSSTTWNDDDSSSTTTDPSTISSWEKETSRGYLPLYEGISDKVTKTMDPLKTRQKPKFVRCNALKHIDYDAVTSSSSSLCHHSAGSPLYSGSVNISDRTSFQVEENDGELEQICKELGFSCPESLEFHSTNSELKLKENCNRKEMEEVEIDKRADEETNLRAEENFKLPGVLHNSASSFMHPELLAIEPDSFIPLQTSGVSLRLIGQLPRNFLLNFKFLTALHLSRKLDFDLPSSIGDVKSLQCLDVSYTPISWLPESIGLLQKLQTLKLRSCRNLVQLPESITSLDELQTLHLRACVNLIALPKGIKVLIKLRDLDVINCPKLKLSGEPNEKLISSEINLSESLELKESYANLQEKVVHEDEEYDSLPKQLKRLCLYCSLFPSHYEFRRDELVQMWIAEGLIEEIHGGVMEDIGGEYFMSLRNKSFLVPSRCDYRLDFDSVFSVPIYNPGHLLYKGNPLKLSRLGRTIAPFEYFVAVDGRLDGALEMTQHLSLICKDIDEMTFGVLKKFKHLRTLLVLAGCGSSIKYVPRDLFLSFRELRTLNLSQTLVSELPSSIRNAKSLRYLDLSNTLITRLPESIDSLHTLQTVRLRGCVHFLQLPKGMKKLINLRHIDLDIIRQLRSMPPHLGSLTNLQTLSAFLVGRDAGCRVGELKNLNDLRGVLRISRLENVSCQEEAKEAALIEKIYLQRLELRWSSVFAENTEEQEKILECLQPHAGLKELQIQQYAGSRLPTWISNPCFTELIVLTLYRCKHCELLPSIGQLPMLKSLSIIEMNEVKEINYQFLGKKNPVDQGFHAFSKLEILEVDIMLNLKLWKDVNIGDLPSLLKLTVDSCPELTTLPSLSWLKSLKHLELRRCPKILTWPCDGLPASLESFIVIDCPELKEWCRVMEGEDWRKKCHLPSIWLDCEEVSKSQNME